MRPFYHCLRDIRENPDLIRRRRYGVIEMADQRLQAIRLRPFPKLVSVPEIWLDDWLRHRRTPGDRLHMAVSPV